tara:strand:- start:2 stop:307 length:306 start_codon:yes stop_codon:yes gene_type:complete
MAEPQENPLNDLVQHALAQDFNKANKIFGDLMGTKIQDALDQEKIKLADQIYNGAELDDDPEEEEMDLEDEDIEAGDEDTAEEEAEEDPVESEEDPEEPEE